MYSNLQFPKDSLFLVTGGAGFIGSNLCEAILNLGYKVRCLDDLSTGKQKNVDMFLDNPKYEFVKGDIKDLNTCMNKTTSLCQDKHDNYSVYMTERREKFQYSISVLNAAKLKRKANIYEELPQALKDMDYEGAQYWIYLVINYKAVKRGLDCQS